VLRGISMLERKHMGAYLKASGAGIDQMSCSAAHLLNPWVGIRVGCWQPFRWSAACLAAWLAGQCFQESEYRSNGKIGTERAGLELGGILSPGGRRVCRRDGGRELCTVFSLQWGV
jgi:hypothetical protein